MSEPIKIHGKLQVCVIVKNLQDAMKRYRELFGIGPFAVYTVDTRDLPGVTYRGNPADYRVTVGMAQLGPNAMLELMENERGASIYQEFQDQHGEGLQHLGVFVDQDYKEACQTMLDHGFAHTQGGPILGENRDGRFDYFDTQETMGTTLELLDMPEVLGKATKTYP